MRAAISSPLMAVAALTVGLLAGCGNHPTSTPIPSATVPTRAALDLKHLAAESRDSRFTATAVAHLVGGRTFSVAIYLASATRYRIDIAQAGKATTSLYGTAQGNVACSIAAGVAPLCFLVAGPGKQIPAQWDAGIELIFIRDLPALATSSEAFTVTEKNALAATKTLRAARCFTVSRDPASSAARTELLKAVDVGTYCLSPSGPPRRLDFASGSLTLLKVGRAPTAAQLKPPAAATKLPTTSASPTKTVSPKTS